MKTKLLKSLLAIVCLLCSIGVYAQLLKPQHVRLQAPVAQKAAMAENTLEFGYCGDLAQNLGFGMKGTFRALMKVTAADATKFAGAKIVAVKAGVGSFSVNPSAQIVILSDLNGSYPVYSQEFTPTKQEWNEVTLDTPYTLDSKEFYVGYQIYANSSQNYPFGIDDQQANPNGDIVGYLDEESGSYQYLSLGSQGFGNNCIKLVLTGDDLPKYDLALKDLTSKQYIATGTEFSISATVKNEASEAISTFDVSYQIGNAEPVVSAIVLDKPLTNTQSYTFSIDKLVVNEDGPYDVIVTVSNPNGQVDENEADNSMTKAITVLSTLVPRKVLLESFMTTHCTNSPRVRKFIENIHKTRSDVVWLTHHSGYGIDEYTIDESIDYLWFYGNSGTFTPAVMLDRRCLKELGAQGIQGVVTAPVFFPESEDKLEEFIDYCISQPSFISLSIRDLYIGDTHKAIIKITGESTAIVTQTHYLNIFLTDHGYNIRKVLTSTWGDVLTFDNENKFEVTYTCELNDDWEAENMNVVAFVSNYNENNFNECTILNTEWKSIESFYVINGIKYKALSESKLQVIDNEYSGNIIIPDVVELNGNTFNVTSIAERAFYRCTDLTEVTIPNSVTEIGNYAFEGCTGLTSITIPNSVIEIGMRAFHDCTGLKYLTLEDGDSDLNLKYNDETEGLFYDCPLETLYLGRNLSYNTSYSSGYSPFNNKKELKTVTIGNCVTSIGDYAFSACTGLTEITIPDSVTKIGGYAFALCTDLTEITIPNSVTSIGNHAFYGCTGLTHVIIGNSVTSIGSRAFEGCTGLTEVTIGNSVTSIGGYAFSGCTGLTEINIPNSVTSIGQDAFYGCI